MEDLGRLTSAGIPLGRESGMHVLRHFCASVLLEAAESIKVLSEYLRRTRAAVDRVFRGLESTEDGPDTAHGARWPLDPHRHQNSHNTTEVRRP